MSKIFLICKFVQTKLTDPPCSRTRAEAANQHAESRRIDVAYLLEVDDQMIDAPVDQRTDGILHFRRRVDVDFHR